MLINVMGTEEKTAASQEELFTSIGSKAATQHQVSKKGYTYLQGRFLYRNLDVDSRPFWANSPQFLFIEGEKLSTRQHAKAVDSHRVESFGLQPRFHILRRRVVSDVNYWDVWSWHMELPLGSAPADGEPVNKFILHLLHL